MAVYKKYDFSSESGIKDNLFSDMCAAYDALEVDNSKAVNAESVSFSEIANEVFGRPTVTASRPNEQREPERGKERERSDEGGRRR
ncbi:MAG: hypothetical protein FWE68_05130 [Defluviitaleaceae bacterium]|nr:hypothetical protein [Defluviitaleaceae bacterium]